MKQLEKKPWCDWGIKSKKREMTRKKSKHWSVDGAQ